MQSDKAQIITVPAPIGGWNARDALPVMEQTDALTLDNVFPESNLCRVIGAGSETASYALVDGAIQTFAEFIPNTGGYKAIAADGDNFRIVNSAGEFEGSTRAHGGGGRWESVNFRGSIILVNGTAAPEAYNGTSWSNPSYTGIADPTRLTHVDVYKSRLYFIEKEGLKIWYGGLNSISGALTEYDVSGIVRRGGQLVFAGSVTKDIGSGLNDIFIIVTNQGEVLFFSGDNPGAANWSISGRAYIGIPLGKRSFCSFKSDLLIATTEGIVSALDILESGAASRMLSDKIQDAYNLAATAATSYDGWELKYWPSGHMLILNVPQTYPTEVHQYAMNTFTGAWCRFKGIQASALCVIQNKLFYAGVSGSNVKIFQFGRGSLPPADIEIQSAFLPLGSAGQMKQVKSIRPYWNGPRFFSYYLECPTDFETVRLSNLVRRGANASTPWGSDWGSPWTLGPQTNPAFFSVSSKVGVFFGYRIKSYRDSPTGNTSDFVPAAGTTLSAVSFIFEPGGVR